MGTGSIIPVAEHPLGEVDYSGPPYLRVIQVKIYRGYVEPRIISKAIYNVI